MKESDIVHKILKYQNNVFKKMRRCKDLSFSAVSKIGKRVLVWGAFDCLHFGHIKFLEVARQLGEELYVIVVPDSAVVENKNRLPFQPDFIRKQNVESLPYVKCAFIDSISLGLHSVDKIKPDVICLGNDQSRYWARKLQLLLKRRDVDCQIVRLPVFFDLIHTSEIASQLAKEMGRTVQSLAEESWRYYQRQRKFIAGRRIRVFESR
jgi:FAD synthetase